MVGSQGTLGFVAEMTLRSVPEPPARATALVFLDELEEAGRAVAPLAVAGADALEIMDAASLRSIRDEHRAAVRGREAARGAADRAAAGGRRDAGRGDDRRRDGPQAAPPARAAALHHGRGRARPRSGSCARGSAARTGAMRPSGTAFLIEDIAGPGRAPGRGDPGSARRSSSATAFRTRPSSATPRTATCTSCCAEDCAAPRRSSATASSCAAWSSWSSGSTTARSRPSTARAATWRRSCATEWGERAYGVMRARQGAAGPRGDPQPRRGAERRTRAAT